MLFIRSFYQDKCKVNLTHEGNSLRVAYLFADIPVAAGTIYQYIDSEYIFSETAPARYKRRIIELFCEGLNPPYPLNQFETFYRQYQEIKAVKHKNKDLLVAERNSLMHFESLYAACKESVVHSLLSSGLPQLFPLYNSNELYVHGCMRADAESKENNGVPVSEMLLEKWTGDDELYIVTHPFGEFLKAKMDGLPDSEADDLVWSVPMGQLPVLNHLTSSELQLVKEQVFGGVKPMRKSMEEWSAGLKGKKFSDLSIGEFESFYDRDILPHKHEWEERKEHCEALIKIDSLHRGQAGAEIMLCVTAAKTLWDYWVWSGVVPEASMNKFRSALPEGCHEDSAVTFLICNNFDKLDTIYEQGDKKSLEL